MRVAQGDDSVHRVLHLLVRHQTAQHAQGGRGASRQVHLRRRRRAVEDHRDAVAVDADQPARATLEQHPRVATEPHRAIDKHPAALGCEQGPDLVDQDRDVPAIHHLDPEVR